MKAIMVLALLLSAVAAHAADVSGKWKATFEGRDGPIAVEYTLVADGDKLSGTVVGPMGEAVISGTTKDNDVTFTVSAGERSIAHKGKVEGDEMKLTVEFGDRQMEMTAKRAKP